MTQHDHKHDHKQHDHKHGHGGHKPRPIHKNWLAWVVVGLMLAAMLMYVLSDDEALQPGGAEGPAMPAAPAAE